MNSTSEQAEQPASQSLEDVLADRRHFGLNAEQWTEFLAALDASPRDHPRLRRLLSEPSVFDRSADE